MKNSIREISVAIILIVLAIILWNPLSLWMPNMVVVALIVALIVAFGFFASFLLGERAIDERDLLHRTLAGRSAFLAGSGVLILGIVIEEFLHVLDPWLVAALVVMVVVKVATRILSAHRY